MNEDRVFEPLDRRSDAWLEGVLAFDAKSPHHAEDARFVSSVMTDLPEKNSFYSAQLARLFLAASGCSAAALVVIEKGRSLASAFSQAAISLHPAQMITTAAPFAVLLGLVWFTSKIQRD
jgi:hypothetical protein